MTIFFLKLWQTILLVTSFNLIVDTHTPKTFMVDLNIKMMALHNKKASSKWNYFTNLTDENENKYINILRQVADNVKKSIKEMEALDWSKVTDQNLLRQKLLFSDLILKELLPEPKYVELERTILKMCKNCITPKMNVKGSSKNIPLNPELSLEFMKIRDPSSLANLWVEWSSAGINMRNLFEKYILLMNEAAQLSKVRDASDAWLSSYEINNLKNEVKTLWSKIRPFYLEFHAYIRYKLRSVYGDIVSVRSPIPAHLLGTIWTQSWDHLFEITAPFHNETVHVQQVSEALNAQSYSSLSLYKTAEEFMESLNFSSLPNSFWTKSLFSSPKDDREMDCRFGIYNFYNGSDVRMHVCARVDAKSFFEAHGYLPQAHVILSFKNQPFIYQAPSIPGFDIGVGALAYLHTVNPRYWRKYTLLTEEFSTPEEDLNNLFYLALHELPYIPFSYVAELWRWDIFTGRLNSNHYNCHWWQLISEYQGIKPPVNRTEKDFDPINKHKIACNENYIRYFLGLILQFQFHRALCIESKQYDPVHPDSSPLFKCEIFGSYEAGNLLKEILEMGRSRPFSEILETFTGSSVIRAEPLLEYFEPLIKWISEENKRNNVDIGWEPADNRCEDGVLIL